MKIKKAFVSVGIVLGKSSIVRQILLLLNGQLL